MNKSKIEWCNYSWNPVKGLCPVNCKTPDGKSYCYARRMYQRFKWAQEPWLDIAELNQVAEIRVTGKRIFVCSTFELFHPSVDDLTGKCVRVDEYGRKEGQDKARDMIFDVISRRPDLTFIILTKMPVRIDRPMPENVWLGVSVTNRSDLHRVDILHAKQRDLRFKLFRRLFVSFEPLFADNLGSPDGLFRRLNWVIVGRLTGHGHKFDPNKKAIKSIVRAARLWGVPIFLKNNLREIWGEPLIQEFPK